MQAELRRAWYGFSLVIS